MWLFSNFISLYHLIFRAYLIFSFSHNYVFRYFWCNTCLCKILMCNKTKISLFFIWHTMKIVLLLFLSSTSHTTHKYTYVFIFDKRIKWISQTQSTINIISISFKIDFRSKENKLVAHPLLQLYYHLIQPTISTSFKILCEICDY